MNTILVIGAPGQGKTPFVRRMIENNRCFVFDIQNEYGDRTKYPGQEKVNLSNNINAERCRYIGNNVDEFLLLCGKKKDTICVFEEATAFFQGRTEKALRRHLINRYHTGNVSLFLFHSINSVPPRLMEMSNFVVLFKTLDELDNVYRKYNRLAIPFQKLEDSPDGSYEIIKLI
jgi:hypothetical protein